jgi:hypothetical protein
MSGGGLRNKSASKLEKVEVASTSSFGADVDPRAIDLAMRIAERIFLKMKEDEAKNKIEEEENDRWRPNDESTSSQGSYFNPLLICVLSLMGVTVKAKVRMRRSMKVIVKKCFISKKISSSEKLKT